MNLHQNTVIIRAFINLWNPFFLFSFIFSNCFILFCLFYYFIFLFKILLNSLFYILVTLVFEPVSGNISKLLFSLIHLIFLSYFILAKKAKSFFYIYFSINYMISF